MKPFVTFVCLLSLAGAAPAQNYSIAKDQARRAENQNAAASGNQQPPSPPAAPASPKAPPADPVLQATLRNIASLRADIAALNTTTTDKPDPVIRISLLNNLTAAAQATKAPSASVQKLAGHLMPALLNRKMPEPQQTRLARSLHAAFNGAHLSPPQQQALFDDVKKILTDAGTPADDADKVVGDLRQIAAETK